MPTEISASEMKCWNILQNKAKKAQINIVAKYQLLYNLGHGYMPDNYAIFSNFVYV